MKIILAKRMGMCFGVRRALRITRALRNPGEITIYGELVHNEEIQRELNSKGFQSFPEKTRNELPPTGVVLITAHGISHREKYRLLKGGKKLIDTTCPVVQSIHQKAIRLQKQGYFIILIGKRDHVEVQGITGDLEEYAVVQNIREVGHYPGRKLAILCQSTMNPEWVEIIRKEIHLRNSGKEILFLKTICRATRERQDAVKQILPKIDILLVIGGRNSNNTKQLVELGESEGIPVIQITQADELDLEILKGYENIGITAGASTLDKTIMEIIHKIESLRKSESGRKLMELHPVGSPK